ncbi:MAG TPA: ribosome maturation factor RimP, partial [Bacteroidota bacterium]|nr:ribosome maturation factor RimP [Bacteroidota bacterium]
KDLDGSVLSGETYTLTVSSPGLDRPLKFPRQYPKHVGRGISVTLLSGASTTRLLGVLVAAGERSILVQTESRGEAREIAFEDIVEAKVEPRW